MRTRIEMTLRPADAPNTDAAPAHAYESILDMVWRMERAHKSDEPLARYSSEWWKLQLANV